MKTIQLESRPGGFSLIELLIVIVIIAILMTFAVPTVQRAMVGNRLTSASDDVVARLAYAQQEAMRTNRPVQVRFISWNDPKIPGEEIKYRGYQLYHRPGFDFNAKEQGQSETNTAVPVEGLIKFPNGVIMSPNRNFSSIMELPEKGGSIQRTMGSDLNTRYVAFEFLPDGSTNLDGSQPLWFFTLMEENKEPRGGGAPPDNYACITIDAFNGSVKVLRP